MSQGIWLKRSLAIAIAASTALLVGCGEELPTSGNNQNENQNTNHVSVNNPRGTITGVVQDTNGNPIANATVYLGNQTAITNIGGQYYFDDVAVTQVVKNDDQQYAQALALTIVPPAGYLGATVTVSPQAQIFTGIESDSSVTTPVTTFISGFNASAGTAVLPKLTAIVEGVLRNATTGEILPNVRVALDMVSSTGVSQEQPQNGVSTSYSTAGYSVTTNAQGAFLFTDVPSDAVLTLFAEGYAVAEASATVSTNNEQLKNNLGAVSATPVLSADTISPWVKSVHEVVNQNAERALLRKGTTNKLTIEFSETINSGNVSVGSVLVRDITKSNWVTVNNVAVNGNKLDVTLSGAVTAGSEIDVWLLIDDIVDTANNALATGETIGFDKVASAGPGANYVKLALKAYKEGNLNAEPVDTEQKQADEKASATVELETFNAALFDVYAVEAGIHQLNSKVKYEDDVDANPEAAKRLTALAGALAGSLGYVDIDTTVHINTARIQFTPTDASFYKLEVTDSEGISKYGPLTVKELDLTTGAIEDKGDYAEIIAFNADVKMVLQGVEPGDIVKITAFDDFGYSGGVDTLVLRDNVAPTTVLQNSYGAGNDNSTQVVSRQFGGGGELSSRLEAVVGAPYFDLTPRLFALVDGSEDGSENDEAYINTFKQLFELNTKNPLVTNNINVDPGKYFIDPATGVYDANAFSEYLNLSKERTLGVAFSEQLNETLNANAIVVDAIENTVVSGFAVNNRVLLGDNNREVFADLVNFTVDDVYSFILNANLKVINFSGAVSDAAGNEASENSAVVLRDKVPPMVVDAVFNGRNLVITFDKAIDLEKVEDLTNAMQLNGVAIDLSNTDFYSLDAAKKVLTLKRFTGDSDGKKAAYGIFDSLAAVFDLPAYGEMPSAAATTLRHKRSPLSFNQISNSNGVNWDDYADVDKANYFEAPKFAVRNNLQALTVTTNTLTNIGNQYSLTLVVNHEAGDVFGGVFVPYHEFSIEQLAEHFTIGNSVAALDAAAISGLNISVSSDNESSFTYVFNFTSTNNLAHNLAPDTSRTITYTVTSAYSSNLTLVRSGQTLPN